VITSAVFIICRLVFHDIFHDICLLLRCIVKQMHTTGTVCFTICLCISPDYDVFALSKPKRHDMNMSSRVLNMSSRVLNYVIQKQIFERKSFEFFLRGQKRHLQLTCSQHDDACGGELRYTTVHAGSTGRGHGVRLSLQKLKLKEFITDTSFECGVKKA